MLTQQQIDRIRKSGDEKLTDIKKNINHITKLMDEDEETCYNSGFHCGYEFGAKAEVERAKVLVDALEKAADMVDKLEITGKVITEFLGDFKQALSAYQDH